MAMSQPGPILSRRSAVALLAAAGGTAAVSPWLMSVARSASASVAVLLAEQLGAVGDGRTDDAPALNRAIEVLAAQGGGILRLRQGATYVLGSIHPSSGQSSDSYRASICFPAGAHNITIDLNGATLLQAVDAYSLGVAYRMFNDRALRRQIIPIRGAPARGDSSFRVRRADAPRIRKGGVYMLLSSNTVPPPVAYAPIAEIIVADRLEGTRIFTDRPLSKMHTTASEAPTGLLDLSGMHLRDLAIIGPGRIVNRFRRCGNLLQVMGLRLEGVTCEGRGGLTVRGRDLTITDCAAEIQANWAAPLFRPYCLALDTGTSHAAIRNFTATGGTNVTYLHLHEGLADVLVSGLRIDNGQTAMPGAENVGAISILSGSWNLTIEDAQITNNPEGPAIMARTTTLPVGGNRNLTLRRIKMAGTFRQGPVILIDGNPATLDGLDACEAQALRRGRIDWHGPAGHGFAPCEGSRWLTS